MGLSLALAGCHLILGLTGADDRRSGADAGASETCTEYCGNITTTCTGDDRQYQGTEHCYPFCAQLEERGGEPFACRIAALQDSGDAACSSAGPLGVGPLVCEEDPCELYCDLMSAVCPDTSLEAGQAGPTGADRRACLEICEDVPKSEEYAVPAMALLMGGDLNCRIQHINVALAFPPSRSRTDHCLHAAGQGPGTPCNPQSTGVDHSAAH